MYYITDHQSLDVVAVFFFLFVFRPLRATGSRSPSGHTAAYKNRTVGHWKTNCRPSKDKLFNCQYASVFCLCSRTSFFQLYFFETPLADTGLIGQVSRVSKLIELPGPEDQVVPSPMAKSFSYGIVEVFPILLPKVFPKEGKGDLAAKRVFDWILTWPELHVIFLLCGQMSPASFISTWGNDPYTCVCSRTCFADEGHRCVYPLYPSSAAC